MDESYVYRILITMTILSQIAYSVNTLSRKVLFPFCRAEIDVQNEEVCVGSSCRKVVARLGMELCLLRLKF